MDPDSNPPSRLRRFGAAGPRRGPGLQVTVTDGRGRAVPDRGLAKWLSRIAPKSARGELGIALVSNARMRILNRSYRKKDYATDVLSFEGDGLGDLVIATGVAKRQAREAAHSYPTELRVLALHGLLHLLGYDHEDPDDNGRMKRAESRLRRAGGLKAGLIDRGGRLKPAPTMTSGRQSATGGGRGRLSASADTTAVPPKPRRRRKPA